MYANSDVVCRPNVGAFSADDNFDMTKKLLDDKLRHSYDQVRLRQGRPMSAVFADIERKHFS